MNRLSLIVASLALGVVTLGGGVSAQETPSHTVANGGHSVADPNNPIVAAEGDIRIFGDIGTGNSGGEVVGDPAALGNIQSHDSITDSVPPPVLVPEDDPAPAPSSGPAPAPVDGTTTTTTETTAGDGATTTDGGATATDAGTTAAPSYCAGYPSWYDAQVAYEAAGGLNGDPGLVQAADPDYDGVACEELIVY